ncbi:2-amino-4-hydroxy-6-hydroxymethyldihydropteridine diphosphokinase [Bacteroides sp. 224]|uniref:2-amino-4-hydroxy-6- hydroxymethyldihydropteridine diphosphokinase n=1 Tax=Bacteroides sp. 224 TaxID=2302936 RepID=UPI0013D8B652|nr:2-amino-4-hydroxy-6-hydroxymethyldihydropteridine diphosphokinase [Bacteroides sp. 224]NDV65719.1 2-amino-4-hydroxy-6-hydroxymethyldihydropteridine diphosphokinase [Bacteroides sp. 224]
MAFIYLGLGTNLGDKESNLQKAITFIERRIGRVVSLSAFYETAPWGFVSVHSFLNAVVCVETSILPRQLLNKTQSIEKEIGRTSKSVNHTYADRLIDIDLLLYDDQEINEPDLIIPHPLMTDRKFVMEPLAEIAPNLTHPVLKKTMKELSDLLK